MFIKPDCIPCYLKQAISTLRIAGVDETKMNHILLELVDVISPDGSSAENVSLMLHKINRLIGSNDPYCEEKKKWNTYILNNFDSLTHLLDSAQDRLLEAFKISVAGNVIDMGINPDVNLDSVMSDITRKGFDHSDYLELSNMLDKPKSVLVLGDNAGEIVLDKVLVSELKRMGHDVVFSVKSAPILNDATMEDAEQVGMTRLCKVITTGNNFVGVAERECSQEFLDTYRNADVVIAKGLGNFETLEGTILAGEKTFFVLKAKCQIVAELLGVNLGGIVLKMNEHI